MLRTGWFAGLAFLVCGAVVVPFARAASGGLSAERGAIFPAGKAMTLARPCSRRGPGPIEGTWTPARAQVVELEARLGKVFADAAAARGAPQLSVAGYYRQYGGFVVEGRRIIYVNASSLMRDPSPDDPPSVRERRNWRERPFFACDDGARSFGVEYDPATRVFRNFGFDGTLPPPPKRGP
jgi:hypothetical protein